MILPALTPAVSRLSPFRIKNPQALINKLGQPELLKSDPAGGDCARLLELASISVAAIGTLKATALPKTKKAWHIHT